MKFALNHRYLNAAYNQPTMRQALCETSALQRRNCSRMLWGVLAVIAGCVLLAMLTASPKIEAVSAQYAEDAPVYTYEVFSPQGSRLVEMTTSEAIGYVSVHPGFHAIKISQ